VRQQQLEAQVLTIVDAVVAGHRVEDDRVECKADWPADHKRSARQLAGLANAAAGEPILLIVGLDEQAHAVHELSNVEPATWWGQVGARFAEVSLEPEMSVIHTDGGPVVAMRFDTGRAPYVVTTDGIGGIDREVPWRRNASTRSAHRHEILRSVVGEVGVPQLLPISAWVRVEAGDPRYFANSGRSQPGANVAITYEIEAYVEAGEPVRLPEHLWSLNFVAGDSIQRLSPEIEGPRVVVGTRGEIIRSTVYQNVGSIEYVTRSGLHINGSDRISLDGRDFFVDAEADLQTSLSHAQRPRLQARFPLALSAKEASLDVELRRTRKIEKAKPYGYSEDGVDVRVGEFSFGSVTLPRYEGRRPIKD
jgi:hypothetical protein